MLEDISVTILGPNFKRYVKYLCKCKLVLIGLFLLCRLSFGNFKSINNLFVNKIQQSQQQETSFLKFIFLHIPFLSLKGSFKMPCDTSIKKVLAFGHVNLEFESHIIIPTLALQLTTFLKAFPVSIEGI